MKKKLIWALLWTLFVIIGSFTSGNALDKISCIAIPYFDKVVHFVWYLLLYIFWYSYFIEKRPSKAIQLTQRFYLIISIIILGIIVEILQENVFIKRSFDIMDIVVNIAGTVAGFLFFFYLYQHKITGKYL